MSGARVLLVGATGYIGRHVARELARRGHSVVAVSRRTAGIGSSLGEREIVEQLSGAEVRFADVTDGASLRDGGFRRERFDMVVSCLASRTGAPDDAKRIDYQANHNVLTAAAQADVRRFALLSAICVQKPRLVFQHQKLAFEQELITSGLSHCIVRPTAFFKSLSGQVRRVQQGKPFLVFGDGKLTACKPISERDLAAFVVDQLESSDDGVFPIGGPEDPVSPIGQARILSELTNRRLRTRSVSPAILSGAARGLAGLGAVVPHYGKSLKEKAELARIGHYYATESMLVWDADNQRYDATRTPSYGSDLLVDHYRRMLQGDAKDTELGDHAVF